jgi:hypothetical protein
MAGSRKKRLPYQVTRGGLRVVGAAFIMSLCLFWYSAERAEIPVMANPGNWLAGLAAASLMGGALGAAIGQIFRDEREGTASMGAFVGALGGPIVFVLFIVLLWFTEVPFR